DQLDRRLAGEGIEVDDDDVDGRDAVLLQLLHMLGQVAAGKDAAMDCRMQRFYPAVQDFGKAHQLGNFVDGKSGLMQLGSGATAGDQIDSKGVEALGKQNE